MEEDRIVAEAVAALRATAERQVRFGQEQAGRLGFLSRTHSERIGKKLWDQYAQVFNGVHGLLPGLSGKDAVAAWFDYLKDFDQRSTLLVETLVRRGETYRRRMKEGFKQALAFDYDLVVDGRKLPRPVNYSLVRIRPPAGETGGRGDGRPWVIIDPRAGHGSGIGGFKSESEVGVALRDGHPVYFVIFYPDPEPGQTLADVCAAEAYFLEEIHRRHPDRPKPLVTGNCQGGWAAMILAATHPEKMGPLVIAGAPLSYWAGEIGKNPFRYLGGVNGGAVPALLMSDLGGGKFDGAHLVLNFEHLKPATTWWRKNYDIFANVDRDAERFLDFEDWWSGFYFMNEKEIRWIVENLFIGNKLTRGEAVLDDGAAIDLTRIKAPVIVFASHGDDITPPQQALNWIPDLYGSVAELRARGQVIIYTLHDSIGHLGIFVSSAVANTHHKQITSVIKTIESLPPGLYEMAIEDEPDGGYAIDFQARTMEDILSHDDGREDETDFVTVAKLSKLATLAYELTWRPILKVTVTPAMTEWMKHNHPLRLQRSVFTAESPLFAGIGERAAKARAERAPAGPDNPFVKMERLAADIIENNWNFYRDMRDSAVELMFHGIYASPWMRTVAEALKPEPPRKREAAEEPRAGLAAAAADKGGYTEAIVRMLVLLAWAGGSVRHERLERTDRLMRSKPPFDSMQHERRVALIREQAAIVEMAPEEAMKTLPVLLKDEVDRIRAVNYVMGVIGTMDEMNEATNARFREIQVALRTIPRDWQFTPRRA